MKKQTYKVLEEIQKLAKERYYISPIEPTKENLIIQYGNVIEEISEGMKRLDSEHEQIDMANDIIIYQIDLLTKLDMNIYSLGLTFTNFKLPEVLEFVTSLFFGTKTVNKLVKEDFRLLIEHTINSCLHILKTMGYNPALTLQETFYEIDSRVQDPIQYRVGRKPNEKWQKWKAQPKETLYKAQYNKCKLKEI